MTLTSLFPLNGIKVCCCKNGISIMPAHRLFLKKILYAENNVYLQFRKVRNIKNIQVNKKKLEEKCKR